jgi:hypothetical protein
MGFQVFLLPSFLCTSKEKKVAGRANSGGLSRRKREPNANSGTTVPEVAK